MRGKARKAALPRLDTRITPAYAGKSHCCGTVAAPDRDHPRVCGEKRDTESREDSILGSPPRMRGKEHALQPLALKGGITPAYAGKSTPASRRSLGDQDHPRVCGEK